jgi:hypothetical protein
MDEIMVGISARGNDTGSIPLSTLDVRQIRRRFLGRRKPSGMESNKHSIADRAASDHRAWLTFSGPLTAGFPGAPSLVDGNYTLTVFSSQMNGGVVVGDQTATLFRLYGDFNGDRAVDGLDLTAFRSAFGSLQGNASYVPFLDFNGDGAIDGADLTQFRNRFGVILP